MCQRHITISQNNTHRAIMWNFKGCRVRAVFFSLLSHKTHVLNCARGCRIKSTGFFEILNRLVIDWSVGAIRNDAVCISGGTIWPPSFATCSDQSRQGSVNNNIRRHVQIRDAFVRVHHIKRRAIRHNRGDCSQNLFSLRHISHLI